MAERVQIVEDAGRSVLVVDGVIQSVSPAAALAWGSYWAAMVPPFAPRRALVLGLGGATLPHLIVHRWGLGGMMVGVDDDSDVLRLARAAGWLSLPGLQTVQADAFAFARTTSLRFDYLAVDLYRGSALPRRALGGPFLRRLAALLEPPGWLAVNLYVTPSRPPTLRVLRSVFQVEQLVRVGENLVVHGRARRLQGRPYLPRGDALAPEQNAQRRHASQAEADPSRIG